MGWLAIGLRAKHNRCRSGRVGPGIPRSERGGANLKAPVGRSLAVAATVAIAACAGAVVDAQAAGSGAIRGCVAPGDSGQLYILGPHGGCPLHPAVHLSWSRTGARGERGQRGLTGDTGPAGSQGPPGPQGPPATPERRARLGPPATADRRGALVILVTPGRLVLQDPWARPERRVPRGPRGILVSRGLPAPPAPRARPARPGTPGSITTAFRSEPSP